MTNKKYDKFTDNNVLVANERLTATELVISNIKNLIMSKTLRPGDKLPSETELANAIGVSRSSVREAMKILSANGIVEIRRGNGTFISDSTDGLGLDPLLFKLIMNHNDINELKELREMIETGIIYLAIRNRTEEDIEELEEAYRYMEEKYQKNEFSDEVIHECELMFHKALGKATKNKLVQILYDFVLNLYIPNIYRDVVNEKFVEDALECHRPIIDAIKERHFEKGERAIRYSVDVWKIQSKKYK